jgi:hypothetical protein
VPAGAKLGCAAVFVEEPAKHINTLNAGSGGQRGDRDGRSYRNLEVDAEVRAARVVVLNVPGENTLEVPLVPDQSPVQALGSHGSHPAFTVRTQRSAYAFAFGARGCVTTAWIPAAANRSASAAPG